MTDMVRTTGPERNEYSQHGFKIPKPELPIAAAIWKAAETYGRDSNAVSIALFHAVVELEAEVAELRAAK